MWAPRCVAVVPAQRAAFDNALQLELTLARAAAEEALKNAKSDVDFAKAQSELAVMAAQIAALRKYRQKK